MQLDTFSSHGSVGDLRWNLINLHLSSPILFFLTTLFDPVTRELVIHLRIEIPPFQVSTLRRVNTLSSNDIILSLLSRGEIHFFLLPFSIGGRLIARSNAGPIIEYTRSDLHIYFLRDKQIFFLPRRTELVTVKFFQIFFHEEWNQSEEC